MKELNERDLQYTSSWYLKSSVCVHIFLKRISDNCTSCEMPRDIHPAQELNIPFRIAIFFFPLMGIINNSLSLFVMFQSKYNHRILPFFFKCYYVSCFCTAVVEFSRNFVIEVLNEPPSEILRTTSFFVQLFLKTSNGILAGSTVIRFAYCVDPFVINDAESFRHKTIIGLLVLLAINFGLDFHIFIHDDWLSSMQLGPFKACVFALFSVTIVGFGASGLFLEIMQSVRAAKDSKEVGQRPTLSKSLSKYIHYSFVWYLLTTAPYVFFHLQLNSFGVGGDDRNALCRCKECLEFWMESRRLLHVATWSLYTDNLVLSIVSVKHRSELKSTFTNLFCSRRRLVQLRMADSQAMIASLANPSVARLRAHDD